MTAPTTLVWRLAGRPDPVDSAAALLTASPAVCAVCADHTDRTAHADRALGANFTDRSLFRDPRSSRVCPACLWCCSGKPPATLRLWTVVATPGRRQPPHHPKCVLPAGEGLHLTNRSAPQAVSATLLDPPDDQWVVSVALSGQKHVLPYATVNTGRTRWTVRMESVNVTADPDEFRAVLSAAAALRAAGHRADDITTGTPTMAALKTSDHVNKWRRHATTLTPYTGSPLLSLALWCLTKETINDHT